jgi:pyrroline-5-carboxylate reductase
MMGRALVLGALKSNAISPSKLLLYDINADAATALAAETGGRTCASLDELVAASSALLLCTKPNDVPGVLQHVPGNRPQQDDFLVLSIAAGITIAAMQAVVGNHAHVIRIMPNTPALVGAGAAAFAPGESVTPADRELARSLLGSVGQVIEVKESLMDAVTGLSGSGPAYVYTFIEALSDAGVKQGLTPDQARALATQTVLGAAEMVRSTGEHPAILREMVTSPGGTTIAGLAALEAAGFRHACNAAVEAATRRAKELGES